MNRRTIAILVLVIGILLLAAVLGIVFIQQQNQPPPVAEATQEVQIDPETGEPLPTTEVSSEEAATPSSVVEVVVSLQTVPRGYQMTADILTTEMRDVQTVGTNVITNIDDVIGQYARDDIFQGETLTYDSIVSDITLVGLEEFGPSSIIPPGFVAQSIPIDRISSVAYGIAQGDYVDIMIVFRMYQIDPEFQSLLPNDVAFYLEEQIEVGDQFQFSNVPTEDGEQTAVDQLPLILYVVSPFGRFKELATGDVAHISQAEPQRPVYIAMVIQNAKVIQVGTYEVPEPAAAQLPTPTPEVVEGEETPTPGVEALPTATPFPPDVALLALQPQQQLLLRYAIEVGATVDLALRGVNDGQLYSVENIELSSLFDRFNIEVPPDFEYTVDTLRVTATPAATSAPEEVPEGG